MMLAFPNLEFFTSLPLKEEEGMRSIRAMQVLPAEIFMPDVKELST